jgi:hypothetical protein
MAYAESRVTIVNKSASISTVTYSNWEAGTSRSVVLPAGSTFLTRNYYEYIDGVATATLDNVLNLPLEEGRGPLTKCLIQDFAYDKDKMTVTIIYEAWPLI